MTESSPKTAPDQPPDRRPDGLAEPGAADGLETGRPLGNEEPPGPAPPSGPGPETPARPGPRKLLLAAAGLLLAGLGLVWALSSGGPEAEDHREAAELARQLAPVVRAESLDQRRLDRAEKWLGELKPDSPAARELAAGAEAFLKDEPGEAHRRFAAAAGLAPGLPDLISFQAAASLRQGNPALAGDLYRRALSLKEQNGAPPLDLAADQLGLALSLFFLQRPAEALPLAETAWQSRGRDLGPDDPDTLSAANRLGTILVALGRPEAAEALLKAAYREARTGEEAKAALEETRLLLTVLHNQSGRLEELEDFFREDSPSEESGAEPRPETENGAARPGPASPPPATAENLAEWEKIAAGLDRPNPELAAALRLRIIQGREVRNSRDRHQPELRPALLALARTYLAAGLHERALEELQPLEEIVGPGSDEFVEYADLMGQSLAGRDRLKEAENHWQAAADLVNGRISARTGAGKAPDPKDAARSLDLHLKLADLYLREGRLPEEAEIELKAAVGRLGPKAADDYPETARIYLRLARLMWAMGRTDESAGYYRRARNLAEALPPRSAPFEKEFLAETARLAGLEAEALAAKQPRPEFVSETSPARAEPGELPPPDILRLELSALAALGRPGEFQERLEPVLAEAARRHGPLSPYYMRYYSLKLKGLEEEGRIDELTAELLGQAERPPGRNEAERALNRGGALIYAARVNEKAGRPAEALELYEKALEAVSGREEDTIAARRRAVEEALERLKN